MISRAIDMEIVGEAGNGVRRWNWPPSSSRRGGDGCRHAGAEWHRSTRRMAENAPHARVLRSACTRIRCMSRDSPRRRAATAQDSWRRPGERGARRAAGEGYLSRPFPTPCWTITASRHQSIDLLTAASARFCKCSPRQDQQGNRRRLEPERLHRDAHRGRIMEKLNVHSINELVRFAVRNGLID